LANSSQLSYVINIRCEAISDREGGRLIEGIVVTKNSASARNGVAGTSASCRLALWLEMMPKLKRLVAAMGVAYMAEDILQDVYLAVMTQTQKLDALDPQSFRRWLLRVTINRCHDERRRHRRWRNILLQLASKWVQQAKTIKPVAESVARGHQHEDVRMMVDALDDSLKAPLVLRYFHGMNSNDIAKVLQIPDGTVRSRLRTARMKLAAELRKLGYEHE